MNSANVYLHTDPTFPEMIRIVAGVVGFCGFVGFVFHSWMYVVMLGLALVVLTGRQGIEINQTTQRYREVTGALGIRLGKWLPYSQYTDISVLSVNLKSVTYNATNTSATATVEKKFNVCMLTEDHLKRVVLKQVEDFDMAAEEAKEIGESLGMKFAIYSPRVSEQTMARRNRRK